MFDRVPTTTFHPMGVALRVAGAPRAIIDAIDAGLGRYPSELGVSGALDMRVEVHADRSGDPGWATVVPSDDAGSLTIRIGSSSVVLRYATGEVQMDLAASLCAVPDALRLLVESVFTAATVRAGALHAVHSALVVQSGVGLVLRGPSGAGKSTLTYSCLRRGMGVCSDDWLYAPTHLSPGRFAGYPWRMMMTEDAASRFAELAEASTVPHPAAEGRKVPVHPPVEQQAVVADATAVVLLDPSPRLSLAPVSADEAWERFWSPALPTEREHLTDTWVAGLLDRPVFVLRRGTDPDAATHALADLAASLR